MIGARLVNFTESGQASRFLFLKTGKVFIVKPNRIELGALNIRQEFYGLDFSRFGLLKILKNRVLSSLNNIRFRVNLLTLRCI